MIPHQHIAHWSLARPWPTADQVEQDLLLSRAICEIAANPLLGEELVIRGGTAFHKLFLPEPYRYSEDLDYFRHDCDQLILGGAEAIGYNARKAGLLVDEKLLTLL